MDIFAIHAFAWRDAVVALIGVAAIYLLLSLLSLLQLLRLGRRKATVAAPVEPLLAAVDVVAEPLSRAVAAGAASSGRPAAAPPPVVAPPLPDDAELRQLRGEMATLRQDLTRLSGELADLHETIDLMLVTRYVAPRYNEPMELAQKGYDARRIAAASGISLPEAELVVALSRKDFGNDANLEGSDDGPASADAAAAR